MRLIADARISLPFKLDICAQGRDVDPLLCTLNGFQVTLYFPPSLGEDTDGQGIFGDWAWWTGRSLRLVMEQDIGDADDFDRLRADALATANTILRRFLNAYRWRFQRPEVHPVRLDPRSLSLEVMDAAGRREALFGPDPSFFFQNGPAEPPLASSLNAGTLPILQTDVQDNTPIPRNDQLRLDADALEMQGERERADWLRRLIQD